MHVDPCWKHPSVGRSTVVAVGWYSLSDQVCKAGAEAVASSNSIGRRTAIPAWHIDSEEQIGRRLLTIMLLLHSHRIIES